MESRSHSSAQRVVPRYLPAIRPGVAREYLALCKPRIVWLIVFTAIVGMFLGAPGLVPPVILLAASVGIGLAAAAGAVINHLVDRKVDALMARTMRRPLAAGRIDQRSALLLASALCAVSMVVLVAFVNVLTAVLTLLSMVGYSVVYTVFLKRATPQNIVIGGAAGAMPPVLGWSAVTGHLDPHALLLFLIIFAWTPPHFWSLAIYRCDEYAKADIPMLPVTHGIDYTRLQIFLYTLVLIGVSMLPFVTGMSGILYLAGALVLGSVFLAYAVAMLNPRHHRRLPMKAFGYSIVYLAGIFSFLLVDHYLPGWR